MIHMQWERPQKEGIPQNVEPEWKDGRGQSHECWGKENSSHEEQGVQRPGLDPQFFSYNRNTWSQNHKEQDDELELSVS